MSKERTDSARPDREHEQGNADLCIEFTLSGSDAVAGNGLFEVIVEVLIRIEFRAVSGQIEHFDVFFVLFEPPFDEFGVMDPEVVYNEDDLAFSVLDELFEKAYQKIRVEGLFECHPLHLALVVDGTDKATVKPSGRLTHNRCFAPGSKAAAGMRLRFDRRFIVNVGIKPVR